MSAFDPVRMLREQFVATKVKFKWWNQRRGMEKESNNIIADALNADDKSVRGSKDIYSLKIPCIERINSLRTEIKDYWENVTNPYGEDGVRLLPRDLIHVFNAKMDSYEQALSARAQEVSLDREIIVNDARTRLGRSFREGNYPINLAEKYGLEVSYPSLEPNGTLPPSILRAQEEYARAKLQEAVTLAEQAFIEEFRKLTEHLHEKLLPAADGSKKIFRNSAVENLNAFFERFKALNLGSNQELEHLVSQAQELVTGITPEELRHGRVLREQIKTGLEDITRSLDQQLIQSPRRRIVVTRQPQGVSA